MSVSPHVNSKPQLDPLLVVIVGPTASGKTALSLALAEKFGGEIVNCDSVAVYREFEIGTAKPSRAERARMPHHLVDICSPEETMTAGEYARLGREVLADLKARGRLPVVVGGTGLYLRALLQGLFPGPQRSEELRLRLRASASKKGPAHLHRVLARMDRAAAGKIHPNDEPKLIRAIEVCLAAQTPMTELWEQGREPLRGFRILRVGLDPERQQLYARINQRAAKMFESGLVEETEGLLRKYPKSPVLASLGYKQAAQLLRGEVTQDQAITAAQQGHRNYAKRQMTWFRREPEVEWVKGFGDENAVVEQVVSLVERRLQSAD